LGLFALVNPFGSAADAAASISSVTAAAAGRLQRHADGWQVVERARLIIG
jgi:hypothetical protein